MIIQALIKRKIKDGHPFDYSVNHDVPEILSLVEVPIGNLKTIGVVVGKKTKSLHITKPIFRTLTAGPALTKTQIDFARKLAKDFISPLSDVIFSFIPQFNISDFGKIGAVTIPSARDKVGKTTLLVGDALERLMLSLKRPGGQSLFILPTIEQVERTHDLFKKLLPPQDVFSWHSKITSSQKAHIWQGLLDGRDSLIVSTRHGLFLPFTNLQKIYIDDPTNFAYHDDQSPYYNAYKAARLAAREYNSDLIIGSTMPDLLAFSALRKENIKIIASTRNPKIELSDEFAQALAKNDFKARLKSCLARRKKIAILGPFKKEISYFCFDCRQSTLRSPQPIEFCPRCKKENIKPVGFSFEAVRDDLRKTLSDSEIKKIDLVTLDQLAFLPPHYSLVLVPYFDRISNFPYLNYREKLFRSIKSISSTGANEVLLFGKNLQNDRFANQVAAHDWQSFLGDELCERKKSGLPPFRQAILMVIKSKSPETNNQIFEKIQNVIASPDTYGRSATISFQPIDEETGHEVRSKYLALIKYSDFEKFSQIASRISIDKVHFEVDPVELS